MAKKGGALLILLLLGGLAFAFRDRLLNRIQQGIIHGIASRATVDNRLLLADTFFAHHLLYNLKGADRLWPHRVNSLERFRYLYPEFPGFECDIQYMPATGGLRIGHDDPGPDDFADYLKTDCFHTKLFWLDVKNVDAANIRSFCLRLNVLDSLYAIRNRIIVETYDTLTALSIRGKGYLAVLNAGWIDSNRITATETLYPQRIGVLSMEAGRLPAARKTLPGGKQIAWDISFRDGMSGDKLLRLAGDTDLLVCLINVKSPGYR